MDKTRKYYNKAIDSYQRGYIQSALEFCEISISCDIKNKAAIDLKGILYYLKGDITGAKSLWRLSDRENNDSVAKKYLEGIENDEERFKLYVKAVNLIQEVKINEALKLLIICDESDCNSINVNNYLCVCYMKTGEFDKAIECIKKVLSNDVKNEMALESRKNLIAYGVIDKKISHKKIFIAVAFIFIVTILIFSLRITKAVNKNLKVTSIGNRHNISDKSMKPKMNEKITSKGVKAEFSSVDFKNMIDNKDFEKLYEYTEKWKNENLQISDKAILSQGVNLLTTEGATYFYKVGTNFYNNKDYKNAVVEYLKAYEYGTSSYLMPDIIYFMANSYDQLNDYGNALKYYGIYNSSYAKGDYEETVLYDMAIISRDKDKGEASKYADKLVTNYPKSIYNNSNIQSILHSNN